MPCECCRIGMTERPRDGGVAIFWRHVFDADVRDHPATGEVRHQVPMAAAGGGVYPHLLAASGRLLLTWKEPDPERTSVYVRASADGGETWGAPRLVAETVSRSDRPFLARRGKEALLSWHTATEGLRILRLSI